MLGPAGADRPAANRAVQPADRSLGQRPLPRKLHDCILHDILGRVAPGPGIQLERRRLGLQHVLHQLEDGFIHRSSQGPAGANQFL